MIRIQFYQDPKGPETPITEADLPKALEEKDGLLWLDLSGSSHEPFVPILLDTFSFHPIAVDDALTESHAPKLDDWGEYVYIVVHDLILREDIRSDLSLPEVDIFLGTNFLVTHHHEPIPAIDRVWEMAGVDERIRRGGPDRMLFFLFQELIHDQVAVLQKLEEQVERIEDLLFVRSDAPILSDLFSLKRSLLNIRRTITPQQEVFVRLSRDRLVPVDSRDRIFFRDVHDQSVWLFSMMENLRDLVTGTLEIYLSVVNNRMNEAMRLMAVITTLFLPLTFITGFFGMNFFQAAHETRAWTGDVILGVSLAAMLIIPAGMFFWIKRRRLL